jgi:small subunit ribosomal protein S20
MAHSLSARKRVRQNETSRARNRWRLRTMRDAIKEFRDKLAHGSVEDATTAFRAVSKVVDKTAAKGVIHKNQASRRKSRMSAALKARKTAKA